MTRDEGAASGGRAAERAFEEAGSLLAAGQYLAAHDRAAAALAAGADHDELRHRAVLALAQAGATGSALRLYGQLGMGRLADPEVAALGARLLKDQALLGTAGAARAAETAYGALWRRSLEPWHGVNAAAMALLSGDPTRARARITALGEVPDDGSYWAAATLAEAALLRGDAEGCARGLETAERRAGSDIHVRRTTRRQMRWEAALLGIEPAFLDVLRIPGTLHFCGAIPRGADAADLAPDAALRERIAPLIGNAGFGFGSLAAGADIVIAEALLDAGAELTAVLPFPPDAFAATSVLPAGEAWLPRFRACLAQATVVVLEPGPQDDLDYAMASGRAMGLARLHAQRTDGRCWQVAAMPDGDPGPGGPAGTAADVARWREAGGETRLAATSWAPASRRAGVGTPREEPERTVRAVLFGDLPGFGALDDRGLAAFYRGPLRAVGALAGQAAYRNAWGDAVQMVFDRTEDAAACALAIDAALSAEALEGWGLPSSLRPRIALDWGPLLPVQDAVQGAAKFAGRVMTRAARIEPVTPPGLAYATEAFACELALHPAPRFLCDYAGLVPAAKGFGTLPLYAVREA